MTAENTMTTTKEITPEEKIEEILKKCETKNYIFRGENADYSKISSGLYRQYYQSNDNNHTNDNEFLVISKVEKNIVEEAKKHIRPGALNIEVLTELQHYGGKTALLDFSKNIYIALFFACNGNFDENGRVILFETSGLIEKRDINYDQIEKEKDKKKHTYILISPTSKNPRVVSQSSLFIRAPKGYLEVCKDDIIEIENNLKEPLLNHLSKHFDIKEETVYNDIQGFIRNQHNHPAAKRAFYRGVANFTSGKYKEAITDYNKAIKFNPRYAEVYSNLGVANNALGNYKEAIKDYNKAIELNSQFSEAYYNRGNVNDALGNYKEAIKDYTKAIELNPQDAEAYYNRGNVNDALGEHEVAIEDYNKAIEIDPQYAKAYYNRGNANYALGKYEEAIKDYKEAIKFNFQYAEVYNNRGNANRALGENEEAIEDYDKAIEIDPQYAEAYYNRGNHANYVLKKYKEAIKDYTKAIELNPQDAVAYLNRGNANYALGEPEEAIEDYTKAIELDRQYAEAYFNRGNVNRDLGKFKEAMKNYTEAKTLFEKEGNTEMVKECEEAIEGLKN